EHRHHEARRAEAALRGVGIDERLLHRMERPVRARQTLDRENRAIVDLRQHHQAGIYRAELQRSVDPSTDDDGPGPAIPLRTTFLGSGEMRAGAKPVEHRHARRGAILAAWRSVQQEAHRAHARLVQPWGGNRSMLEHVSLRLKTVAPHARRGPTLAHALIR